MLLPCAFINRRDLNKTETYGSNL